MTLPYEQTWTPSEKEIRLHELAKRYHDETEAYDRTVCTGPIVHGEIFPATPREGALINRNAMTVRAALKIEAAQHGIGHTELGRAIARYSSRRY